MLGVNPNTPAPPHSDNVFLMKRTIACTAVLFLLACTGEQSTTSTAPQTSTAQPALTPPTPQQAREIIEPSPEYSDFQFTWTAYSIPLRKSMMNDATKQTAKELESAGWIEFQRDDLIPSIKASKDKRFIVRPNGFMDIVPLAKKEFGEVTSVNPLPDGNVAAEFNWKWIRNEVGQSFKTGPVRDRFAAPHVGRATLMPNQGKWEVLIIEPVS